MKCHEIIIFQDKEFLLIGNKKNGGAIATEEQYNNFEVSYAHLFPDGEISRYGQKIGEMKDIRFTGVYK